MRVLVTDGGTRPALAITRSLGAKGHQVFVAAERRRALATVSRYCDKTVQCPSPKSGAIAYSRTMAAIAQRHDINVLLPVNEIACWSLAQNRGLLPPTCALPLPATESLGIANDKSRVLDLARALNIPVPMTHLLNTKPDAVLPVPQIPWPVVIKPARSRVLTETGWISTGVGYAATHTELATKLSALPSHAFPVLLQERINGAGFGIFTCYRNGQPLVFFAHQRLREKPPSGGVSVLCESVPLDPIAVAQARQLMDNLHWHGVAMIEFKRDSRDGGLKLMEINGRFWGSLQLAIDAGVDFPEIVATMAAGNPVWRPADYRTGIRSRWLLGDLDALLSVLKPRPVQHDLPENFPARWQYLRQFLRRGGASQRNEVWRADDPAPGLLECMQWLTGGAD